METAAPAATFLASEFLTATTFGFDSLFERPLIEREGGRRESAPRFRWREPREGNEGRLRLHPRSPLLLVPLTFLPEEVENVCTESAEVAAFEGGHSSVMSMSCPSLRLG